MQNGDLIVREHPRQHYKTLFDRQTGFFIRKEESGFSEPAWAMDGPELIDLSITNYCERGCSFCYRETSNKDALFMSIADVENVVSQAENCGTLQIALGGGNPNQHPQFIEVLKLIREHGIVPSFTSNGDGLTDDILQATSMYCGAMAVSVYPPYDEKRYEKLLARVKGSGVKVNLHAIIKNDTIDVWIRWLEAPPKFFKYINAVIFLNYKPVRGNSFVVDMNKIKSFFEMVNKCQSVKVGFDSCSISGITRWMDTPSYLIEPCEAASFSAFISEDMKMYPCSFMTRHGYYGDLRKQSILDIWQHNLHFQKYRSKAMPTRCKDCSLYKICKGGCHLYPAINFC